MEDFKDSLEKFGWSRGVVEKLEGVSLGEVGVYVEGLCMARGEESMDDGS